MNEERKQPRLINPDVFGIPLHKHMTLDIVDLAFPITAFTTIIKEKGFGDASLFFTELDDGKKKELRRRMDHRFDPVVTAAELKYPPEAACLLLEYLESIPGTLLGYKAIEALEQNLLEQDEINHSTLKKSLIMIPLNLYNLKFLLKFFKDYLDSISSAQAQVAILKAKFVEALFYNNLSSISTLQKVRILDMFMEEYDFIFDTNVLKTMNYKVRESLGLLENQRCSYCVLMISFPFRFFFSFLFQFLCEAYLFNEFVIVVQK